MDLVKSTASFTDVIFTENEAGSYGGAMRVNGGVANIIINQNATYSGNKAATGQRACDEKPYSSQYEDMGGFMFLQGGNNSTANFEIANGKTLTIGEESAFNTANLDSIASAHGAGTTITKTGDGTLTVNGSMKAYTGAINVNEGTLTMATGFGEIANGVQMRVNGSANTMLGASHTFAASTMKVGTDTTKAIVNMGDLNVTFATTDTEKVTGAGTIINVQNGSFTAKNVTVGNKEYSKYSDGKTNKITTTGWGEFDIAKDAKAEIASLTVKGGTFDKTGVGILNVKGDVAFVEAEGVTNTLNFKNGGLAIGGNFDSTKGTFTIDTDASSLFVGKIFTAANDDFLGNLETVTVGALRLNGKATDDTNLVVGDSDTFTFTGLGTNDSFFNGNKIEVSGGTVKLGTAEVARGGITKAAVTVTNGKFNVKNGEWTVGKTDVASGATLSVAAGGALTVDGTFTSKTESAKLTNAGDLSVKFGDVLKVKSDSWELDTANVTSKVTNTGTITLLGFSNQGKIDSTADLKAIRDAVATGGFVKIDGFKASTLIKGETASLDQLADGYDFSEKTLTTEATKSDKAPTTTVNKDVKVAKIDASGMAENGTYTATVETGKTLALAGKGDLVKITGDQSAVIKGKGTLDLTGANGNMTAKIDSGDLDLKAHNSAVVYKEAVTVRNIASAGGVQSFDKDVTAKKIELNSGAVMDVKGTLTAGADGITVGSNAEGSTAVLKAAKLDLDGKSLFADPAWVKGVATQETNHAAKVAVEEIGSDGKTINGDIISGQAAQIVLGSTDENWIKTQLDKIQGQTGATWGNTTDGVTAVLAVRKAMKLDASKGAIEVNGALTSAPTSLNANKAIFAANSLFIVDAAGIGTDAAITGDGSSTAADIDDNAKLMISDAKAGETVTVLDKFVAGTSAGGWSNADNLYSSSTLQEIEQAVASSGKVTVKVTAKDVSTVYGKTDMSSATSAMLDEFNKKYADKTASNAGLKFLAAAVSTTSGLTKDEVAASLTSVNAVSASAGAANVGTDAANLASNAATARVSMAAPIVATSGAVESADKIGMGVWFMPLYQSNNVDGMKAGSYKTGFESDVYGGAFGADYTFANGVRLGAALNMGTGESDSKGDLNATKSDSEFFGASLYAGYRMGNLGLMADFGYTRTNSEVDMSMPVTLGGDLEADVDADIYSVGARAEYKIGTGIVDLVPHAGVRYTAYRQESYNVDYKAGGTVRSMEDADMDTWQLPIGVSASKAFAVGAWTLQPRVDLSYIYTFGDTDMDSKGRIAGTTLTDSMNSEVFDEHTAEIGLGLDSKYGDAWTLGLDYTYQGSENREAHGVYGTVRFEF